ncbi:unnamed protein product [Heterobilharzia americana]|nr:unnamed protein product [Heterobilharzia americana]
MKMKEYSDSFHSSSSSPSSSSPPSINSPFNFQSSYDKKFNANSQHSSLSPPFSGISSSFLLHQNTDSYEIVNGMNYEGQLQTYHLSSHSLVQSPNIQASYRLPPPPPLIPTPHSTIILPEQPVLIKGGYYHKGHRKRLAEDSNMELFTPTKARCDHLLVNNRGCGVKRVAAPQTKEAMNIISDTWNTNNSGTSIQAQFPNVCQLLCESNSCSHSLPKPIKTNISDKNQCIQPGVGFNEAVARTTLCVAALCLIALNPAQITNQMSWSTPKMEKLSTSRSLLYYFDPSGAIGMPNSWFISFMYCLQWFIALILCSWACHRKQISFQLFNWSRHGNKIVSVHKAKSHYRQANMAISQLTWSIADYHLKLCLHSLGSSTYCELTQSVHTTSHIRCWYLCLRSIIASIMNLLTILFIYLPYWVWMCYFRKFNGFTVNTSKQANSTTEHKISSAEVRLRLMELYLFDYKPKNVNPYNSRLVKFFQSLDDLSLGLMCTRDFLDASTHGLCDYKMIEPVGSVSTSEYNFVDNNDKLFIHLLPRQGITLGLFLKRKLGMDYLGSLIIRMTIYVTMRFDLSQLWRTWFSNVLFVKLITGNEKLNFGAALSSTTTTTSSMREYSSTKDASLVNYPEKNIITQLLIELREHITCHCLKIILYGEINQVKSLQCYIHLLIELSPSWNTYNNNKNKLIINGEIDDKEYEETNDQVSRAHWWAQMLNILWQYRCDQIKLPLQSSLDEEDQIKLMESDPTHCCTPQSLISCSYLGDLVKVLSVINNFNSLDNKTSFHMSLQSVYSSLRSLAKSCRNLNNSHTGMGSTVKSNPQFDYMRFNFLAWSLVATNWFIDVLTVKLKSMKSCKMKETTDISMVLLANGFTDSNKGLFDLYFFFFILDTYVFMYLC